MIGSTTRSCFLLLSHFALPRSWSTLCDRCVESLLHMTIRNVEGSEQILEHMSMVAVHTLPCTSSQHWHVQSVQAPRLVMSKRLANNTRLCRL
jgi:hypothetical protein